MNKNIIIKGSCVTGYGETLIKSALRVDIGIVETMAHIKDLNFSNQMLILYLTLVDKI